MNRKLQNSLTALSTSGFCAAFALACAAILPVQHAAVATTEPVSVAFETATDGNAARHPGEICVDNAYTTAAERGVGPTPKGRKPLVMPYFSFAPRG